ncbi:MAG: hypothetical protein OXE84_04810, partial [Rhodobacteraceae bacterium]|nr:hypothetical protein [Paracoccaceae bacterium]
MIRFVLTLIAAALTTVLPLSTVAACPCTGQMIRHADETNANRNALTEQMIAAIRANAGQVSGYIDRSIAAFEKIQDASDLNASIRSREEMRARAEGGRYDPAASACAGLAGVTDSGAGSAFAAPRPPTGNDTHNQSRNYERCADANDEVCRGENAVNVGIIEDRDEFRDVGGVLDPTSDLRFLLQQPTVGAGTATRPERLTEPTFRLVQNLINPVPPPPVTESQATTPAGRSLIAARQADTARRSGPRGLLHWIQTRSMPALDKGDWARRTAPEGYQYPIEDRISLRQYYDVAIAASWRNPAWHQRVAEMSPEAVTRESVLQAALANDSAWLQFE